MQKSTLYGKVSIESDGVVMQMQKIEEGERNKMVISAGIDAYDEGTNVLEDLVGPL